MNPRYIIVGGFLFFVVKKMIISGKAISHQKNNVVDANSPSISSAKSYNSDILIA